jgi:hypothetical protein
VTPISSTEPGKPFCSCFTKAAGVAEENSRHALDVAQKLSHQLRAAEDRVAELEAEVQLYRDKADRANSGCTKSTRRLRTDFCRRKTAAAGLPARHSRLRVAGHKRGRTWRTNIRQGIGRPFLFSARERAETPSARGVASFIGRVRHKIFCLYPASKCERGIALLCFALGSFKSV